MIWELRITYAQKENQQNEKWMHCVMWCCARVWDTNGHFDICECWRGGTVDKILCWVRHTLRAYQKLDDFEFVLWLEESPLNNVIYRTIHQSEKNESLRRQLETKKWEIEESVVWRWDSDLWIDCILNCSITTFECGDQIISS